MVRALARPPSRTRPVAPTGTARPSLWLGRHPSRRPLDRRAFLQLQQLAGNRGITIGEVTVEPHCGSYERGERAKAGSSGGVLATDVSLAGNHAIDSASGDSVVVADFPIGSASLRPSTAYQLRSSWVGILERQTSTRYELVGYSDCVGDGGRNTSLRQARAQAVAALFPKTAARATAVRGAPVGEHALDNGTPEHRALNRSVIIRLPPTAPPQLAPTPTPEEPHVKVPRREPPTHGCGQSERDMLAVAWPAAKMMIDKAMEMAYVGKGAVNSYLLQRYFGPDALTNIVNIRAGYQNILDGWFDWDPKFECHTQSEARCPNAKRHLITLAYVMKRGAWPFTPTPYGSIHVCDAGFLMAGGNLQGLSATVVHELSHRLDNTTDHAYCDDPPQCDIPTKKAIDNADSYAQYARTVFNASM